MTGHGVGCIQPQVRQVYKQHHSIILCLQHSVGSQATNRNQNEAGKFPSFQPIPDTSINATQDPLFYRYCCKLQYCHFKPSLGTLWSEGCCCAALTMPSPTQESKTPQNWATRAAELKQELMARRGPMTVKSESGIIKIDSQNSVDSMSTNSPSSNVIPGLASTNTPPPTPQNMTSAPNDKAQKIQNHLKELGRIIAFGAAKSQVTKIVKTMKMPQYGPFAPNHTTSLPPKATTYMADCKKTKAKAGDPVTKEIHPINQVSTVTDKKNATVGSPAHDIEDSKSLQARLRDGGKDLEDGEIQSNGSKASGQSDAKRVLLPSAPISRSAASKTLASTTPQEQTSQNSTKMTLPLQKTPHPDNPASEPRPRDETPPTAPLSHKRRGWELQHYRPSLKEARGDWTHETRGNTRKPLHLPPLAPTRPDSPIYKHLHDRYSEHDRPTSQDRDLDDWLSFTGWHNPDFRADFLQRKRRLAYLDREKNEIEQERAELMSADKRASGLETVGYRSSGSIRDGADEFEANYPSCNAGRELFGSPAPGSRQKREYTSDGENQSRRKMSRVDLEGRIRDSSRGQNDLKYGARGDFFRPSRSTPDHLARKYGPKFS